MHPYVCLLVHQHQRAADRAAAPPLPLLAPHAPCSVRRPDLAEASFKIVCACLCVCGCACLQAGFSSSAVFATRFAFLHHPRVVGVVAGGIGGLVPLPDAKLDYPLGCRDYEGWTGRPFDPQDYASVPQLYVNGDSDSSCPFRFPPDGSAAHPVGSDGAEDLSEDEALAVQRNFLPPERQAEFGRDAISLSMVKQLWEAMMDPARLGPGSGYHIRDNVVADTGHSINPPTVEAIDRFLIDEFLGSAGLRGAWGNPGPLAAGAEEIAGGAAVAAAAVTVDDVVTFLKENSLSTKEKEAIRRALL